MMRRSLISWMVVVGMIAGLFGFAQDAAAEGRILIYSPWKDSVMKEFTDLFEQQTGIKAESINISTGEVLARLRVEKARPQADVVHSARASLLVQAERQGLLAEYIPPNAEYVLEPYQYKDDKHFIGTTMYPLIFAYNSDLIEEMGVEPPQNYEDLLDPKWEGKLVMPHPAASGTAYAFVTTVLQMYRQPGETGIESEKGWEYLENLMRNVAQYTRSGSAPSKMVASGEFPVGITFFDRVDRLRKEGYPIVPIFPSPIYAEPSCTSIVANSPNPEGAEAFLNFMLSKEAQELAKKTGNYSVRPDVEKPEGAMPLTEMNIFEDDYEWGAKHKKAIIGEFNMLEWENK